MIIPIPIGEQYFILPANTSEKVIKQKILSKRERMYKFVSLTLSLVGVILWIVTKTSVSDMYKTVDMSLPFIYEIAPVTSIVVGVVFYFLLQKLVDKDVDYVSSKTQNGKVKITPVANHKNDMYIVVMIVIAVAAIVMTFVFPIFSLTSSVYDSLPR